MLNLFGMKANRRGTATIGIRVRTPKNLLDSRSRLDNVNTVASENDAESGKVNRVRVDNFILPISRLRCKEVTDIEECRTIVWEHDDGTIYHQDCTTPIPGHPGKSIIYKVV